MCGMVGIHTLGAIPAIDQNQLRRMMALLHHRGPDEAGLYLDDRMLSPFTISSSRTFPTLETVNLLTQVSVLTNVLTTRNKRSCDVNS